MKIFKSGGKLHFIKNRYLRWKDGIGCCDLFSMYYYLAPIIAKSLKAFKNHSHSYPMCYVNKRTKEMMTQEKYDEILEKMIYGFESIILENKGEEINYKKQNEGLKLFGEYFTSLWL